MTGFEESETFGDERQENLPDDEMGYYEDESYTEE